MISHEKRCIFVHIPKTAGTSIEAAPGHQNARADLGGTQDHRTLRQLQWRSGRWARFASVDNGREVAGAVKSRLSGSGFAHRGRLGVPADIGFTDFLQRCAGIDLLRPQTYWLVDFRGRIGVDMICRFERLGADFDAVRDRLGPQHDDLPHLIRGGGGSYLDAYDDTARRIVADRLRAEIDLFGYTFDDRAG